MPTPFPGIDPFIENQEWEDFHTTFITVIRECLSPKVGSRYVVRVERRVYFEHQTDERDHLFLFVADAAVLEDDARTGGSSPVATATATVPPVECVLPMPEEKRESFLYIRDRETMGIITVLEVLSPGNKRPGSDGEAEYLAKRDTVLRSQSHLVELDLLRGGRRLPTLSPLPAGDYYAIVSRRRKRPRAELYAWPLSHPLPTIPIPLKEEDSDVPLDLQAVFSTVYQRARYDLSIDYQAPLKPPLNEAEAAWLQDVLKKS